MVSIVRYMELQTPCFYFPIEKGLYEVAPGLRPLGFDFGNGERDKFVFHLDTEFSRYHANKLACRQERLSKYFQTKNFSSSASEVVNKFLVTQLIKEYPQFFALQENIFNCKLTGDSIEINSTHGCFDAICSQIQEDVAVVCRAMDKDWLAALHLCSPSHWAAEEKIGKSFIEIHKPVAGIEKINRAAPALVKGMIEKGPFVRFVWGYATDNALNKHPENAVKHTKMSPFILRFERQVIWGLPHIESALFFIRTYFINGEEIKNNSKHLALLRSGLLSMSPESLQYKGLARSIDEVMRWLDEKKENL